MPWDTVGDEIRHRLIDPAKFEDGSFRRIEIQRIKPRVDGIVGKLKGETAMTLQALRFPIGDGWTVESAKEWAAKHFTKSAKEFAMANQRETKDFRFEVKGITEAGQFTGYASVYGVVDDQNDVVEAGAFTKTMRERPEVPILWRHNQDEIIGKGTLVDSESGLLVNGQLELGLQAAKDAYTRLKGGLVKGLSIGYKAIAPAVRQGKRMLGEIKLYEVSLVPFPSNDLALVMSVKDDDPPADPPDEAKEFTDALTLIEQKAGRMISAANRSQIEQCIKLLQSLIATSDTSTPPKDGTAKGASDEPTGNDTAGPEYLHAALEKFKSNLRSTL